MRKMKLLLPFTLTAICMGTILCMLLDDFVLARTFLFGLIPASALFAVYVLSKDVESKTARCLGFVIPPALLVVCVIYTNI